MLTPLDDELEPPLLCVRSRAAAPAPAATATAMNHLTLLCPPLEAAPALEIETLGASASSPPVLTIWRTGTFASGDSSSARAAETGIALA